MQPGKTRAYNLDLLCYGLDCIGVEVVEFGIKIPADAPFGPLSEESSAEACCRSFCKLINKPNVCSLALASTVAPAVADGALPGTAPTAVGGPVGDGTTGCATTPAGEPGTFCCGVVPTEVAKFCPKFADDRPLEFTAKFCPKFAFGCPACCGIAPFTALTAAVIADSVAAEAAFVAGKAPATLSLVNEAKTGSSC